MRVALLIKALSLLGVSSAQLYSNSSDGDASSGYAVKTPPLTTDWTYKVGTNPWPEYPRPQRRREAWQNLNGVWQYQNASSVDDVKSPPFGKSLGQSVLVPSCLESGLSGVQTTYALYSWFSTKFKVPSNWTASASKRVFINFGAVDYEATVFVNGKNASHHVGGYFEFSADITDYLSKNGTNELLVFVHDPTDDDPYVIPIGKQTLSPSHIFYTPCSGIWQSVWIESVPSYHVTDLHLSADMNGLINTTISTASSGSQQQGYNSSTAKVTLYAPNSTQVVAEHSCKVNQACSFTVSNPKLWSPDSPNLYDIAVTLQDDKVLSYTGFRTIEKKTVNGIVRPVLNGEPIFQFGTLDQGYWPDGIYTPPNREAMEYDIKTLKSLGFNMLRKHIKVENALYYESCDKIGILVIQDMPALRPSQGFTLSNCTQIEILPNASQQAEFDRQLGVLVRQLRNYPSIGTWVIYNEGWGQITDPYYPEIGLTEMVRQLDPTRLIDSNTGWLDHGAGDYSDNHHYANPQCGVPFYSTQSSPYDPKRIGFQGEFGGIGNNVSIDHLWNVQEAIDTVNQTYEIDETIPGWNFRGHMLLTELRVQTEMFSCSGAVWTQTTDVEGEVNGLLTYDRRLLRPYVSQWQADIKALYTAMNERTVNSTNPAPYNGPGPDGKVWWNYESTDWQPNGQVQGFVNGEP